MTSLFSVQAIVYGFALWFGLYLLGRTSTAKPGLLFAGLGLVAYAVGLAIASVSRYTGWALNAWALLPASFWFGAAWTLLPGLPNPLANRPALLGVGAVFIFGLGMLVASPIAGALLPLIPLALALTALIWIGRAFRKSPELPRPPLKVLFTATLFFALGLALLIFPVEWFTNDLTQIAIGGDLALLGYAIGKLDAYDEGTALFPDALRSLAAAGIMSALVGGQMAALVAMQPGLSSTLLFYTTLSTVIALMTLQGGYQKLLDRLIFGNRNRVTTERETLISVSEALPRLDAALDPLAMEETEFIRLTRRALSYYNDLGKLSASPLTQLPIISARLRSTGQENTSLTRAHELRRVLAAQVLRLKPYSDKDFDSGDDWRYYNALYFPYVLGLRPYTVRLQAVPLEPAAQAALEWFQSAVPERTLYNWQNAAAKIIARQLRESETAESSIHQP